MRWDPAEASDVDDLVRRKRLSLLARRGTRPRRPRRSRTGDRLAVTSLADRRSPCGRGHAWPVAPAPASPSSPWASTAPRSSTTRATSTSCFVASDGADPDPSLARSVVAIASQAYRIDTNLRPEGRSGVLVRSARLLRRLLGSLGSAVGVPGAAEGPPFGRRRRHGQLFRTGGGGAPVGAPLRRRRPGRAAHDEGPDRSDRRQPRVSTSASSSGAAAGSATSNSPSSCCSWSTAAATRPSGCRATLPSLAELADAGTWRPRTRRRWRSPTGSCAPSSTACSSSRRRRSTPSPPTASRGTAWHACSASGDSRRTAPGERFDAVLARHQGDGPGDPRAPLLQAAARSLRRATTLARPVDAVSANAASPRTPPRNGSRPSASPTPTGPARPSSELTRGLTRSSRLMQQLLPLLARLALRVARPRSGPPRAADTRRQPAPPRPARDGLPGVARARPPALPAARDEPAPGRDHRPAPRLRRSFSTTRPLSPRRNLESSSKRR